jgi:hypothetical protein
VAVSLSFGLEATCTLLANGLFGIAFAFFGVRSSGQSLQLGHRCCHLEASKAYSVPEVYIDNLMILNIFLLIQRLRSGRKLTKRKHNRSANGSVTPCKSTPSGEGSEIARGRRPDASGSLYHMVVRGIERKAIVHDPIGREARMLEEDSFLRHRLENYLNNFITFQSKF